MQDFSKIRIFDEFGYEILLQRFYNFDFTLTINSDSKLIVNENPIFYVLGDQNSDQENNNTNNFWAGVINKGKFHTSISDLAIVDFKSNLLSSIEKISFNLKINENTYFLTSTKSIDLELNDPVKIYTGDYNNSFYLEYSIKSLTFSDDLKKEIKNFVLNSIKEYNLSIAEIENDQIKSLFPYYKFYGSYNQEKTSVDLVSATTFFILDEPEKNKFQYPISDTFDFKFYFNNNSDEIRFINNTMLTDNIEWSYEINKSLNDSSVSSEITINSSTYENPVPLNFAVGFLTDTEGIYQNTLEIYIQDRNTNYIYSIGFILINSEAIGEDERYRTLFSNFGIPDPIEYQEVFKDSDPNEEKINFDFINKKSKELFLTYEQIFPYAGSYKALINAVKFLGYDDVYFKEYYKLIDPSRKSKKVSYESIDMTTGETLEMKLKKAGLTLEDFLKYKKLNQLSLIYHLNQKDEDYEIIKYKYVDETKTGTSKKLIEIPTTINIYEYQTTEILAKLYSLKKWLEKYLIPANAYISDVTGEGVYFYRYKNLVYNTVYNTADYYDSVNLTPYSYKKDKNSNRLIDSSALVTCSLYEFNNTKFKDFDLFPIRRFITKLVDVSSGKTNTLDASIKEYTPDLHVIDDVFPVSNPLEAMIPIDEFNFEIQNSPSSGTLYEYARNTTNPIYIKDNEIYNYNENLLESYIKSDYLPTILIRSGNIRKPYGNWQQNIVWTIKQVIDPNSGDTYYQMKNVLGEYKNYNGLILDKNGISLVADSSTSNLVYTEKTKWDVPLLEIQNYKVNHTLIGNQKNIFDISSNYVLEILDGEIQFKDIRIDNSSTDYTANEVLQTNVLFSFNYINDVSTLNEQTILPTYTYKTKRYPLYEYKIDSSNNKQLISNTLKEINQNKQNFINSSLFSDVKGSLRTKKRASLIRRYVKDYDLLKYNYGENIDYSVLTDDEIDSSILKILDYKVKSLEEINSDNILELMNKMLSGNEVSVGISDEDTIKGLFDSSVKFINDLNNYKYVEQNKLYVQSKLDKDLNYELTKALNDYDKNIYSYYSEFLKQNSLYHVNKNIDLKVNHIGNYDILVKGYNKYNSVFVKKSNTPVNVYGVAPKINVFTNQEDLNSELYLNSSSLISLIDDEIKYPKIFRINNLFLSNTFDNLSYYNISYIIDTPKKNDYFYLNNFTEQATKVLDMDKDNKKLTLQMLDENPNCQELYITGLHVNVYVYDETKKKILATFENLIVSDYYHQDTLTDTDYYDNSKLILYNISETQIFKYFENNDINNNIENNNIKIFVGNIQELEINENNILNNYINKTSTISITNAEKMFFHVGDVIKIIYKTTYENNDYMYVNNTYIGETSYRIISSYISDNEQFYILNGLIDLNKLNYEKPVKIFISYANTNFTNYIIRINENAEEISYQNNYNDTIDYTARFNYNADNWLGYYYIDNNYSGFNIDFNIEDTDQLWVNNNLLIDTSLYKNVQSKVDISTNKYVIVNSEDVENTYFGYKNSWRWITNSIEDLDNWDPSINSHDNYTSTLFRSINDILSIKTLIKGRQDLELTTTDFYGNRLINQQIGILNVV